jgi:hypothetical protein
MTRQFEASATSQIYPRTHLLTISGSDGIGYRLMGSLNW